MEINVPDKKMRKKMNFREQVLVLQMDHLKRNTDKTVIMVTAFRSNRSMMTQKRKTCHILREMMVASTNMILIKLNNRDQIYITNEMLGRKHNIHHQRMLCSLREENHQTNI